MVIILSYSMTKASFLFSLRMCGFLLETDPIKVSSWYPEAGTLCFLILYLHVYISIFSPFVLAVAVGSKGAYLDYRVNL